MVTGMSKRADKRKYKRREKKRKRKNHIFLAMMIIPVCTVIIALAIKMNNQNVRKGGAVGAEYMAIKSDGNVTEEEFSVSEETESALPDSYRIEGYEWLSQNPELPTGCEITSLTSVLNYYGCDVDKTTMADNYLKKGYGSFYEMFLGNPRESSSFGCMAQTVVDAANKYFNSNNILMRAENISGSDFDDILKKVSHGNPVVIWNTIGMEQAFESQTLLLDGEEYAWIAPEHCVVITGYDLNKSIVYIMDPMVGNVTRDLETFEQRYESMHSQAMYIAE